MENQLDQNVVNLAKAIRQVESGGRDVAGASGERGAYQFTEPTWKAYSSKYGINVPLKEASLEQQNEVVYKKIKEWKEAGYDPGQIASMWNAGEGRPNAHLENWRGVNKYGVNYDTPAYAQKVATAYQQFKQGGMQGGVMQQNNVQKDPYAISQSYKPLDVSMFTQTPTVETNSNLKNINANPYQNVPVLGQLSNFGIGVGTGVGKALIDTGTTGLKVLRAGGKLLGLDETATTTGINALEKTKKAVYQDPFEASLKTNAGKLGNITGQGATYVGGIGAANKAMTAPKILKDPTFQKILTKKLYMDPKVFNKMPKMEQIKWLGDNIVNLSTKYEKGSIQVMQKALLEIAKDSPGLIQKALGMAKGGVTQKVLGGLGLAKAFDIYSNYKNN